MKLVIILTAMLVVIGGCTHSSNLVSATTDTARSGALLYTLTTPDTAYTPHDTLDATLSVRKHQLRHRLADDRRRVLFHLGPQEKFREGDVLIPKHGQRIWI